MSNKRTIQSHETNKNKCSDSIPIPPLFQELQYFKSAIHSKYGKLYMLSKRFFWVFDIDDFKWNLIKTHNHSLKHHVAFIPITGAKEQCNIDQTQHVYPDDALIDTVK